jgi:hypothetical protein
MPNEFDPYREALVVEARTYWPEEFDEWEPDERYRIEVLLHSSPKEAAEMKYARVHTGFCREITVTPEDLERVGVTVE